MKPRPIRLRTALLCSGCLLMLLALSGCQTISFYSQAISGQYEILVSEVPVRKLVADPATPPKLKAKLELALKLLEFASHDLRLPADGNYRDYVDLHRPCVSWIVNVAPALSLRPKTWWFPVVGSASYRGYFSEEAAHRYARIWENKGWDVYVDSVQAYSTLGWFHDPLLNTHIYESEGSLADLIFHELAHQRLYVAGDTDFNEAFAMAVAGAGVRRWFEASHDTNAYQSYQRTLAHERDFADLIMATRGQLDAVYANSNLTEPVQLQRKADIVQELRQNYARLKARWGGAASGYDYWFSEPINNAKLNTVSAYYDLKPAFEALLQAQGGDMEKFYHAVGDLAKMPVPLRHQTLRGYLKPNDLSR
ncbi:MAG: aminopeptidase [Limisphaerales bacterium]